MISILDAAEVVRNVATRVFGTLHVQEVLRPRAATATPTTFPQTASSFTIAANANAVAVSLYNRSESQLLLGAAFTPTNVSFWKLVEANSEFEVPDYWLGREIRGLWINPATRLAETNANSAAHIVEFVL
jgi:hypothetical protein